SLLMPPPPENIWGHIVFALSVGLFVCVFVCLFVRYFNIAYNFGTIGGTNFILHVLGMYI
ncbi:MAG: hypothetical protein ABW185_28015, partial [Sedimenticola sp.]